MPIAIWYDMREGLDRLEERTKQFGIDVIALSMKLERMPGLSDMASQLRRAAGSVAANHRAMRRARSMKEFAAKLQIVNEESDECVLWLEMADQLCEPLRPDVQRLLAEARELRAIFAKARATTRRRLAT